MRYSISLLFIFIFSSLFSQTEEEKQKMQVSIQSWILNNYLTIDQEYNNRSFESYDSLNGFTSKEQKQIEVLKKREYKNLTKLVTDSTFILSDVEKSEIKLERERTKKFEEKLIGWTVIHTFSSTGRYDSILYYNCEFEINSKFEIIKSTIKETRRNEEEEKGS